MAGCGADATLANGVRMPRLAFGTWQVRAEDAYDAVSLALRSGFRHIDTAAVYNNEEAVGRALRDSGLPRNQLFVTTKLSPRHRGTVEEALDESLQRLQLDHVDCFLVHWPGTAKLKPGSPRNRVKRNARWRDMCALLHTRKCRAVGVSNFTEAHLQGLVDDHDHDHDHDHDQAGESAWVLPMVNQIELHPGLPQHEARRWCDAHGVAVMAYSPLGVGNLVTSPQVVEVGARVGRTPAQVLLRWGLQQGWGVVVKTVRKERMEENAAVWDFDLGDDHLRALAVLAAGTHYCWDPNVVA